MNNSIVEPNKDTSDESKCQRCHYNNNESLADICAGCCHMYISRFRPKGINQEPAKFLESNEVCDYCVDRNHSNCRDLRSEYFPLCFKGRKLKQ
jgi:hypothetical protein